MGALIIVSGEQPANPVAKLFGVAAQFIKERLAKLRRRKKPCVTLKVGKRCTDRT